MTAIWSFRAFRKTVRAVSYEEAFRAWAAAVAQDWKMRHPGVKPFSLEQFDGCTIGLDVCRPCCLVHDIGTHYARTARERVEADSEFRRCVASIGEGEDKFGWAWGGIGAVYGTAVRLRTEWLRLMGRLA
jgi:hypothetical protein